ncbi:MAG: hypothetical protein R2733_17515 [Acidimicrobiales bacterium]
MPDLEGVKKLKSCPTFVRPMPVTGFDSLAPFDPEQQRGASIALNCPNANPNQVRLVKSWFDRHLPPSGVTARILDERKTIKDRDLVVGALDALDGKPLKRKNALGAVEFRWGGQEKGPNYGLMGVRYVNGRLQVDGFCNGWDANVYSELVASFRDIGLGIDDMDHGLPGGWARIDYAAGFDWQREISRVHQVSPFLPAYSEEIWLDSIFADELCDSDADIHHDERLIRVTGDRASVRRALFCINGLLAQTDQFSHVSRTSAGDHHLGPWYEGPAVGLRFPGVTLREAFAARDNGAPRTQRSVTVAATFSAECFRDGTTTPDDPAFIAETERFLSLAMLSLRRCLAATWPVEVDPESDFVTLDCQLTHTQVTVTLTGELNDAQTAILEKFAEMSLLPDGPPYWTHPTGIRRLE